MSRHRPLPLLVRAQLFQHVAAMEKAGLPAGRAYALLELGPAARTRIAAFGRLFARGVDPATAGANSGLFTLFETRLLRARLLLPVATLLPAVRAGATLAEAIGALHVVDTAQLAAFAHTGEESGTLAEMLMRHADTESASLALAQSEIVAWLPRVLYAPVALWMIVQLLGAPAPGAAQVASRGTIAV